MARVKTSITLPPDLLKGIDRADSSRSSFLERAARHYLAELEKSKREKRDAAIIEARARQLNDEALDVVEYQNLG